MVVKPFSHLVRRSTKVLAHHAQSITAASSTSTSQHFERYSQYRFGKTNPQQRESFHSVPLSATYGKASAEQHNEGSFELYSSAWQKHQPGDEWHQFQLTQRIGWKPARNASEVRSDAGRADSSSAGPANRSEESGLERAHSASDVATLNKQGPKEAAEADAAAAQEDADAIAEVDAAIAQEIKEHHSQARDASATATAEANTAASHDHLDEASTEVLTPPVRARSASPTVSLDQVTPVSSVESIGSNQYVDHIVYLEKNGAYAQIPAVFEALLRRGATPPVVAYNALIAAAIRVPTSAHQVVSKVLDVYADMLRRNVFPNKTTFTMVLEVLAVRATQVKAAKLALEQTRSRFFMLNGNDGFAFRSQETEYEILREDDSLARAMKVFDMATDILPQTAFSAGTYRVLIQACADHGELEQMLRLHAHMESKDVVPYASVYPAMIRAFAASGDLSSAVETYEGYKTMATTDDHGELKLLERADESVYAALVKGYLQCGQETRASSFFEKLGHNESASDVQNTRMELAREAVAVEAFLEAKLDSNKFDSALEFVENQTLKPSIKSTALGQISAAAADSDATTAAIKAYSMMERAAIPTSVHSALLAMHLRRSDIQAARAVWSEITSATHLPRSMVAPAAVYALALARQGAAEEGLVQARRAFGLIRDAEGQPSKNQSEVLELVDEAIEHIGSSLAESRLIPSASASMTLMWTMVENGGLLPAVAEQLLASLGPEDVSNLAWQDLKLALQVQAGIVASGSATLDIAHNARLAHLLKTAMNNQMIVDRRTVEVVDRSLAAFALERPDIASTWKAFVYAQSQADQGPQLSPVSPAYPAASTSFHDAFDPHATSLDQRGSTIIVDELDKQGPNVSATLNEALARFKNIRRAGRHPRYIAYAKLISAAAKDGRINLVQDLYGMAKQDVPLLPQYPVVRHGWASILDAMVAACLTVGNRQLAAEYHQQLRDIGASPSANTFGLYITTLKESTKTFDEAAEAVKIFQQAKTEGVQPSSFLYNALIGKLGKARRIDDCLFYFAEMRSLGIRPTSVTYGTVVNALCRVSDERFAEDLFDEMESMPNYKPRPAPYNSIMQFFLTTKRDSSKVLEYYQRMRSRNIQPTMHTYKLLIDTHATLEPINLPAAEAVIETIKSMGQRPEAVHYASLIHAKGCVLHDMAGARKIFDEVMSDGLVRPQPCLYQALFESMAANHCIRDTDAIVESMNQRSVKMTPYLANALIHGWAMEKDIGRAKEIYEALGTENREPSTYEAMTRAFLATEDRASASEVVQEMLGRGYPNAVSGKILELVGHGMAIPAAPTPTVPTAAVVEAAA